jgi:MSHA biogenesis protein MshL
LYHFSVYYILLAMICTGCAVRPPLGETFTPQELHWVETPSVAAVPAPKVKQSKAAEVLGQPISLLIAAPVDLKELCLEIGRLAHIPIYVAADVVGHGTAAAHQQPVGSVLQQLCKTHKLRARYLHKTVIIEPDTPYIRTYVVPLLALKRHNRTQTVVMGDLDNSNRSSSQGSSILESEVVNDLWAELCQTLDVVLGVNPSLSRIASGKTREPPPVAPTRKRHELPANTPPAESKAATASQGQGMPETGPTSAAQYTCHRHAGIIIVRGTSEHHHVVGEYLQRLQRQLSSQVLIEAKILEVTLHDTYKSGVNWRVFRDSLKIRSPVVSGAPAVNTASHLSADHLFSLGISMPDINLVIRALSQFGHVRTLSNPRLAVMNNQPAILKVAHNYIYFTAREVRHYRQNQADYVPPVLSTTESKVHSVPIGLIMSVQPAIDVERQEIVLSLKPTISVISKLIADPMIALASEQRVVSQVPVTEVRELDSVLRLKSGGVAIVGGLMQERRGYQHDVLPGTESTFLEGLFSTLDRDVQKTELVILLRATLIDAPTGEMTTNILEGEDLALLF